VVQVGDEVEVPEHAYRYGTGVLRMRVSEVGETTAENGRSWVVLTGVRLTFNGQPCSPEPKTVQALVSALLIRGSEELNLSAPARGGGGPRRRPPADHTSGS
jgi:hypothetical protein